MDLIFNGKECQILNFTDLTTYRRLEQEKEANNLLKTLNASVHHEMIAPLKGNIELLMRLLKGLKKHREQKQMVSTIIITT